MAMMAKAGSTKPPIQDLIASTADGRDITRLWVGPLMEHQDRILRLRGDDLEIYTRTLEDDQAFACFQQRRSAVVSRQWDVVPGADDAKSRAAAAHLQAELLRIGWDRVTEKMLLGIWYGYQFAECVWQIGPDGKVRFAQLVTLDPRRLRFDKDAWPRLITSAHMLDGEAVPDRRFWWYTAGGMHDQDPYGRGLAHWCYWPVYFKRQGIRFWLTFLDKFGMGTTVGKYPAGTAEADKRKLLAAAQAIKSDSAVVIPDGMMLELLQQARSSTSDFGDFTGRMDAAISKAILSQTMTTDNGSSNAQAQVHQGVKLEVVRADADLLSDSFNAGPASWLAEWNFPGAAVPRVIRRVEDQEDLNKVAERDMKLASLGWRRTAESFVEVYGDGYTPEAPEPQGSAADEPGPAQDKVLVQDKAVALADDDVAGDAIDAMTQRVGPRLEQGFRTLIEPIVKALQAAETAEQVPAILSAAMERLTAEQVTQLLAEGSFLLKLAGEAGVRLEGDL
jgi:phage gp29-like protein